jgi:hypothetical protein
MAQDVPRAEPLASSVELSGGISSPRRSEASNAGAETNGESSPARVFTSREIESFAHRNEMWDLQRKQRCQALQRARQAREEIECSFHPLMRAAQNNPPPTRMSASAREALTERLTKPVNLTMSAENAQWCENREREALQECTFQPNMSRSTKSYGHRPISANTSTSDDVALDTLGNPGSMHECVAKKDDASVVSCREASSSSSPYRQGKNFAPVTNAVPCTMQNALAYLSDDVFTRLTRGAPEAAPQATSAKCVGNPPRNGLDESSVCNSTISRSRSESGIGSAVQSFLHRQEALEAERQARLAQLEIETAPSHRPEINERSVHLASRKLARGVSTGAINVRGAEKPAVAACSFKPKITTKARNQQARTVDQLSTGDQKHRDARVDKMRKEQARRESQGVTFSPHVNKYPGVVGRLRVLDASETLLERMDQQRDKVKLKCSQKAKQSRAKEDAEHTFAPEVRRAPEFVRCMAESYRMLRAHREKENEQEGTDIGFASATKPEWR